MLQEIPRLNCIREAHCSNLGCDPGSPQVFSGFPQSLKHLPKLYFKYCRNGFFPRPFQFIVHRKLFSVVDF